MNLMNQIKIERYNKEFVKVISEIIKEEVKDETIQFVTITDVKITNDLSFAKVYFTVLDETKKEKTLQALQNAASFIRGKISELVEIRHTPELIFVYDTSIAYGEHIETIIENLHKKKS